MPALSTGKHELKTWPGPFEQLAIGAKRCEVRKADRPFRVGDALWLREWDPFTRDYTGRHLTVLVTHMIEGGEWGVPSDMVVMSIMMWPPARTEDANG